MKFPQLSNRFARLFSACLLALLFVQPAQSQLRLGVIGGANFASLSEIGQGENLINFDNATAYHAGIFLDMSLGPIGLRPAAYYLNAGSIFNSNAFSVDNDFDVVYVTIPVDLIFSMGVGPVKPYFFAGPEFRLLNSADAPSGLNDDLQSFTMGASTGVGMEINLPGSGLTLYPHLRFSFGLSNFTNRTYQIQGVSVDTGGDSRVNMWLLSLGIGF